MPAKTASVSLDDHFSAFAEDQVAAGEFASVNDVVRAGLELLEAEDAKLKALRAALIEGEESGLIEDFDFDAFLAGKRRAAAGR